MAATRQDKRIGGETRVVRGTREAVGVGLMFCGGEAAAAVPLVVKWLSR